MPRFSAGSSPLTPEEREALEDVDREPLNIDALPVARAIDEKTTDGIVAEKGPRSRIVQAILLLLYVRPMRSSEIASLLNKKTRVVSSYLSYWKARGYVEFKSGYWMLTKKGEEHVQAVLQSLGIPVLSAHEVVQLAQKLAKEQVLDTINSWAKHRTAQDEAEIQSFTALQTSSKVGKLVTQTNNSTNLEKVLKCLEKVMNAKDLSEDEAEILRYMVKHYAEWGSTYLYLDQLSEDLHYSTQELLVVLRKLQSKKLVYLYTDRRFGIRVGLGKGLKQILDTCTRR